MNRAAGVVSTLTGLGFGIPGIVGLAHFSRSGTTWTFLGFPTYGGGPFERIGPDTSIPLLAGFVSVCGAEIALGVLILQGAPSARAASYALLPFELAFWVGFALPFGLVLGLVRALMLAPPGRGGKASTLSPGTACPSRTASSPRRSRSSASRSRKQT